MGIDCPGQSVEGTSCLRCHEGGFYSVRRAPFFDRGGRSRARGDRLSKRAGSMRFCDAGRRAPQGGSVRLDRILNVCLLFQSPRLRRLPCGLDCRIAPADPAHARLLNVAIVYLTGGPIADSVSGPPLPEPLPPVFSLPGPAGVAASEQ